MESVHKNLVLSSNGKKLLLHACCAPCSGSVILSIQGSGIDFTIFLYNPNIHPKKEYEIREDENIRLAEKCGVPIVDAEYDIDNWYARAKGMEFEPERGSHYAMCSDTRMERTALYAHENGFDTIATSLGISRWKDLNQMNEAGKNAASKCEGLAYWDYDWRKNGGSACNMEICKSEKFYQQKYCDCAFSLCNANKWRIESGREKIRIGEKYYGN